MPQHSCRTAIAAAAETKPCVKGTIDSVTQPVHERTLCKHNTIVTTYPDLYSISKQAQSKFKKQATLCHLCMCVLNLKRPMRQHEHNQRLHHQPAAPFLPPLHLAHQSTPAAAARHSVHVRRPARHG